MGAIPAGGNIWKTIIIGVLSTLLAYVIYHFLFDKKNNEGFAKKKEATISAWKAIGKSNEFFLDDFYSSFCRTTDKEMIESLDKAIDKQISDYELVQKKSDLDDDLGLYINRYLERGKDLKKLLRELYDVSKRIEADSSLSEQEKETKLNEADSLYMPRLLALPSQDSNRITALHKELTEKYGNQFKPFQKQETSKESVQGKWREGINKFFSFNGDGSLLMTVDGKDYYGSWSLFNNVITLSFSGNSSIDYNVTFYGPDYIWFKVNDAGADRMLCRQ